MRKEILTKLSKNEITVEEAEERLDNYEKFQKYLNDCDYEGDPYLSVEDKEIIPTIIAHKSFEFDKDNIDIARLDAILRLYDYSPA